MPDRDARRKRGRKYRTGKREMLEQIPRKEENKNEMMMMVILH